MPQKVAITKSKMDTLAQTIARKANENTPLTITEMTNMVDEYLFRPEDGDNIGYGITAEPWVGAAPVGTATI